MTDRGDETTIPAPKTDPGAAATDDHAADLPPEGGHQPTGGLDRGVATEHLSSPSQGAKTEPQGGAPGPGDEAAGGGPSGAEDDGGGSSGPMFEPG